MGIERLLRNGEPRINSGPLLCLNPTTGEILWSTRLTDALLPPVYGDPTDLLVAVSQKWNDDDLRHDNAVTLDIQLLSGKTGEVVAKSSPLSASRPIRCTHVASTNTIEIVCRDSVISIRAEPEANAAP